MISENNEKDRKLNKSARIKALTSTALFYILLAVLLINIGMTVKLPLPGGDEGIEVMLGEGDFGQDNFQEAVEQTIQLNENIPVTQPNVTTQPTTPQEQGEVITQTVEEAPVVNDQKDQKKEVQQQVIRQSNPLFEYSKNKSNFGKGNNNQTGNQGNPNGTPNSTNPFGTGKGKKGDGPDNSGNDGQGGGPGTGNNPQGFAFDLKGRKLVDRPVINDETQYEGKIVLEITVDRRGKVIKTEVTRGSTTTAGTLVEMAKQAALKVSFTPDPDAPEEQYGTMTFNFRLR